MNMTPSSDLLLYFGSSSTLVVIRNNKIILEKKLWPRDALNYYKKDLPRIIQVNGKMFRHLFSNMFNDANTPETFYLQYGVTREKGLNLVYKFNTSGELVDVFALKPINKSIYTRFTLEVDDLFYAIEDTNLTIYKTK